MTIVSRQILIMKNMKGNKQMTKNSKTMSFITVLTIAVLALFLLNEITTTLFLIFFVPLSLAMLIFGSLELKNVLKSDDEIESKALELKNRK